MLTQITFIVKYMEPGRLIVNDVSWSKSKATKLLALSFQNRYSKSIPILDASHLTECMRGVAV